MRNWQTGGSCLLAIAATLALAGCDRKDEQAKPQAALSAGESGAAVGSGGRVAAGSSPAQVAKANAEIDFGDDNGKYARDGECDDKRFSGDGMTETPLLESDIGHDAADCRTAFSQGRLTLASEVKPAPNAAADRIQWGDDDSKFALDGECDDKRFTGPGMTETPLLDSDIKHDATDCRAEFVKGMLRVR